MDENITRIGFKIMNNNKEKIRQYAIYLALKLKDRIKNNHGSIIVFDDERYQNGRILVFKKRIYLKEKNTTIVLYAIEEEPTKAFIKNLFTKRIKIYKLLED